jgi:predicted TIM-barrel fold metal-dependent hydrolase
MAAGFKMIDGWVNRNVGSPTGQSDVAYLFPGLEERRRRGTTLSQLVDEMDEAGVERAVLCAGFRGYDSLPWMEDAVERHPDRFTGSLVVDPRTGMEAVRLLETTVRQGSVTVARVLAMETQLPYDHAAYYPVYAKCVELGIPISVNVGLPGPRVPGRHQHPLALDEVCWFFPDLTVVMSHGGDPWTRLCIKLAAKWPNLHYMTAAYSPKRLPVDVIDFANERGADKVIWASDYPILEFRRCRDEIAALPFRDEERREKFAYANARRLFFSRRPS